MAAADDEVRKAAELKLWLETRIAELQDEVERLKESLGYVDATLRATTFRPASEFVAPQTATSEKREIKRDKGGQVIATASISPGSFAVVPNDNVSLKSTTPPFKSFLIGKILEGMKTKDQELVVGGKLQKGQELGFEVQEADGAIKKLTVYNYREKARLNELLSTVGWTFSRMLEK